MRINADKCKEIPEYIGIYDSQKLIKNYWFCQLIIKIKSYNLRTYIFRN